MRKIVTLILVLGIASMASADLTWTTTGGADLPSVDLLPGGTVDVRIASDYDPAKGGTIYTVSGNGDVAEITAQSVLAAAGGDASIVATYTSLLWVKWEALDSVSPFTIGAGPWLEITITAPSDAVNLTSTTISSDHYATLGVKDLLTVNIIPEPATIALLGLGGLLLRRRK